MTPDEKALFVELYESLRDVVAIADRKTVEFDRAHAALTKASALIDWWGTEKVEFAPCVTCDNRPVFVQETSGV